jgi:Ca2+/H+ antiporter
MRKLLLASFALVPLTVVARLLGLDPVVQFGLAVLALAPLAWLISEATDQAAQQRAPYRRASERVLRQRARADDRAAYGYVLVRSLGEKRGEEGERGEQRWTLRRSLILLGTGTLATAAVSEAVTGSIRSFADTLHLSEFFVAAVIVAVAGNAVEHGAAVVVAVRGELKLAADIALESSAQVAALVIPGVALLSWLIEPFPLAFSAVELVVLSGAVAIAAVLLYRGRSTRTRGLVLAGAYFAAAAAFLLQ